MIQDVLGVLDGVKRNGDGWMARCPAHDDQHASLSIKDNGDDWPLFKCFVGCTFEDIREALKRAGVDKQREVTTTETRYPVYDADGKALAVKVRIDPGKRIWWEMPDGSKSLKKFGLSTDDMLYRVEALKANPDKSVVICEGEKAAKALADLGVSCALGTVGGAERSLSPHAVAPLKGRVVYLWPDNDEPGKKHMAKIARVLEGVAREVHIIDWTQAPEKGDAADFVARGGTRETFGALCQASKKLRQHAPYIRPFREGIAEAEDEILRFESGDFSHYISTGLYRLDRKLGGGLRGGEMTLLGAPTGGGKTTIVQQFAMHAQKDGTVLIVSPEMSLRALVEREVLKRAGVSKWDLNPWHPPNLEARARVKAAFAELRAFPPNVIVLDKTDTTMDEITEHAENIDGLRLVVVDYAQQVAHDPERARAPRYVLVGDVGSKTVDLAMRLDVPVIVASQVNVKTDSETVDDKYTFRESQTLEHKAHNVIIFDADMRWDASTMTKRVGKPRIYCRKQRSGPAFSLEVTYDPATFTIGLPKDEPQESADKSAEDLKHDFLKGGDDDKPDF